MVQHLDRGLCNMLQCFIIVWCFSGVTKNKILAYLPLFLMFSLTGKYFCDRAAPHNAVLQLTF